MLAALVLIVLFIAAVNSMKFNNPFGTLNSKNSIDTKISNKRTENGNKILRNFQRIRGGLQQRRPSREFKPYDGSVDKSFYILTTN